MIQLDQEVIKLFSDPETIKILITVDEKGQPHAVVKQSLFIDENNNLVYLELLESSQTNKNLVESIWFNRKVAVTILKKRGQSYQIKGRPVKAAVSGALFRKHYTEIRQKLGDVDLAAVWIIEPEEVINKSFTARRKQEEISHPYFKHLDRLAK